MPEETKTNEPGEAESLESAERPAETPATTPPADAGEAPDAADALLESAESAELSETLEADAATGQETDEGASAPADASEPFPGGGKKWLKLLAALLLLAACAAAGPGLWYRQYCTTPTGLAEETTVIIPKGAGARRIGELLAEKGVLKNDIRYVALVRLSGLVPKLKAGEYRFAPGMTPPEILQKIADGKVEPHPVTVVEGLRLEQIAEVFARDGWVDAEKFLRLARDPAFIKQSGLKGDLPDNLEGYLFPDTYFMTREMNEEELLRRMVARFQSVWDGLPEHGQSKLRRHEILTLASVVEKETGAAAERPLIARVFLNRLDQGMRLQSDPTVIYGMGAAYTGKIRKADLRAATSHNTYVIPGLPPGPICSPGRAALAAVLAPAESDALYFVSKNDGAHVFSKTLAEHNRAVNVYQRGKKQGKAAEEVKEEVTQPETEDSSEQLQEEESRKAGMAMP